MAVRTNLIDLKDLTDDELYVILLGLDAIWDDQYWTAEKFSLKEKVTNTRKKLEEINDRYGRHGS